jgi:hypothetical protein
MELKDLKVGDYVLVYHCFEGYSDKVIKIDAIRTFFPNDKEEYIILPKGYVFNRDTGNGMNTTNFIKVCDDETMKKIRKAELIEFIEGRHWESFPVEYLEQVVELVEKCQGLINSFGKNKNV